MTRTKENLKPTPEAVFAMRHWHNAYASQRGGSMDFYLDYLSDRVAGIALKASRPSSRRRNAEAEYDAR